MPRKSPWTFEATWPHPPTSTGPQLVVTVIPDERDKQVAITVELRFDNDGSPYVIGIAVRKDSRAGYPGTPTNLSPRDVQRMPLATYQRAALAFASAAGSNRRGNAARAVLAAGTVLAPPERPTPGVKPSLKVVADLHRHYEAKGERSPAQAIAARYGVPRDRVGRVHQWILEARKAGLLERSPHSRQRDG